MHFQIWSRLKDGGVKISSPPPPHTHTLNLSPIYTHHVSILAHHVDKP